MNPWICNIKKFIRNEKTQMAGYGLVGIGFTLWGFTLAFIIDITGWSAVWVMFFATPISVAVRYIAYSRGVFKRRSHETKKPTDKGA